ncbi:MULTISPECIES: HNH endonuclease [Pseudomonas]|uniref:HNH endonuclease n=1 Tax=Pseudomonas TaxID=286 RepID=UPI00115FE1A6|nr:MULTISPECIES: HNH endonuclease [Pseudomonas]
MDKPAITGLVIDRNSLMPGKGYFELSGRQPEDFACWRAETEKSKNFDWLPFEGSTDRSEVTIYRIIRDTLLARRVKQLHNYQCQLCGHTIVLPDGSRYAEAHHVQPLGAPHNGPDILENIVCVCPNHHAELDYGARTLNQADLRPAEGHSLGCRYLAYHNTRSTR